MNRSVRRPSAAVALNITLLILLVLLCHCKTAGPVNRKSPSAVAERFFLLLKNQDYEKAKKLSTESTARLINAVQTVSEWGNGINLLRDNKKELVACEIRGSWAVCTYHAFSGPDIKVYLVKEKQKWCVDLLRKDDPKP